MSDTNKKNPAEERKGVTRRDFLKTTAVGAAAAALAACTPTATQAPGAATAVPGAATAMPNVNTGAKQTVRYLSWWFEEGNRGITWNNFIKEFNEKHPDIEVKAEQIPFDTYTTKTIVGAQSGKLDGDILMATPELAPRLIRANLLYPLDSVLTTNNIKDLSSAHDALRKDGHLYGLDMVTVAFGLIYNSQMYKDAGVSPAKTPEELVSVSKELTNRDNQKYGFWSNHLVSEASDFWFKLEEYAMPFDGVWAKGKTPLLTSEPIIKGLTLFKQLYDVAMPQGADRSDRRPPVWNKRHAQQLVVSAAVGQLQAKVPGTLPAARQRTDPMGEQQVYRPHPPDDD